jgi:hypothetical protein
MSVSLPAQVQRRRGGVILTVVSQQCGLGKTNPIPSALALSNEA